MDPTRVTEIFNSGATTPFDQLLKFMVVCMLIVAPLWFRREAQKAAREAQHNEYQLKALMTVIENLSEDAKSIAAVRQAEINELIQYRALVAQYERDIASLKDQLRVQSEREAEAKRQIDELRVQVSNLQTSLTTLVQQRV
jgi:chromosome segregation ATPase